MLEVAIDHGRTTAAERRERWRSAVRHGAAGYAARADTELEVLAADCARAADIALESLCRSTRASLLRQAGRPDKALVPDARALALIGLPTSSGERMGDNWARAARIDALVGLAADNLGRFAFGASERLLRRARTLTDPGMITDTDWECGLRPRLRCEWVSTELGLYRGDPVSARTHSQAGLDLLAAVPAEHHLRHRIKTELIAAAADAAAGKTDAAIDRGHRCRRASAGAGLLPLQWAATALLGSLMSDPAVTVENQQLHEELTRRGMSFGR